LLTPGLAASREHCNSALSEHTAFLLQTLTAKIQVSKFLTIGILKSIMPKRSEMKGYLDRSPGKKKIICTRNIIPLMGLVTYV